MKQFNLDIILKRSKLLYKKSSTNYSIKQLNVLGQSAENTPNIKTMLGSQGLSTEIFTNQFNAVKRWKNILLPTTLKILKNKTFSFIIKNPTVYNLIKAFKFIKLILKRRKRRKVLRFRKLRYKALSLMLLYKIFLIKGENVLSLQKSVNSYNFFATVVTEVKRQYRKKIKK